MKQTTVRALLSRLTEQLLVYFSQEGQISESKEFAERLAIATWEGLILLLRQSIAHNDEVLLEEVGLFQKVDDQWFFEPAASLTEVDAMKLSPLEEHQYLAQKALFYLNQGTELLANIPKDQTIPAAAPTAEEELRLALFSEDTTDGQQLSGSLDLVANQLRRAAFRLQGRRDIDRSKEAAQQLGETATEYYGTTRAKAGEYYDSARETAGEYYEATRERATELYDTATSKAGDVVTKTRDATRQAGSIQAAVEAGKKAYVEEKRKTELSGRTEKPTVSSEG